MAAPVQVVVRFDHYLVGLTATSELFGQVHSGWESIPGTEDPGRIASVAVRLNGSLVAVTATGRLYEQYRADATMGDYFAA